MGIPLAAWPGPTPRPWKGPEIIAAGAMAILGLLLRWIGYADQPALSRNWDEMAYAWSGLTLLTRGVPYGWSFLPHYPAVNHVLVNGIIFPQVHPFLDHPPLFSFLVGSEVWLFGARDLAQVTTVMTRPVSLALAALSIFMMYALARHVLPTGAALVGTLLFASAPAAVFLGRVTESEALLSPLLLASLLLVRRVLDRGAERWSLVGIAGCCLAAALTKAPGLATGLACAAILASGGRWRLSGFPLGGMLAGLALYAAYGWLIDWHQFLAVISDQAARREGVLGAYEFLAAPAGVSGALRDGWWLLGWAGLAAVALRHRRGQALLLWPALMVALMILLLGAEGNVRQYGWYRIYVYPLVYLGAGYACWEAARTAALGWVAAVLMLGIATTASLAVGYGVAGSGPPAITVGVIGLLAGGAALLAEARREAPRLVGVARGVIGGMVGLALLGNVAESALMSALKQPL